MATNGSGLWPRTLPPMHPIDNGAALSPYCPGTGRGQGPTFALEPGRVRGAAALRNGRVIQVFVFYLFATLVIASAVMTISARNPVHSVLWLILAFFNAAGLFLLIGAEFLAFRSEERRVGKECRLRWASVD